MKFKKLNLDESLFDAPVSQSLHTPSSISGYDDDFISPEYMPDMETSMKGPKEGSDTGVADLLIDAINDEWEAIRKYNSLIACLRFEAENNPTYNSFVTIIEDIVAEENKHVGQLQKALENISPNAKYIEQGRAEGQSQFNFSNGQLQVQSWDTASSSTPQTAMCTGEEPCSLIDVDDDM